MDRAKIIEVLRATLDANQQQQAHEQLQQVYKVFLKKITGFHQQTHGKTQLGYFALEIFIFFVREKICPLLVLLFCNLYRLTLKISNRSLSFRERNMMQFSPFGFCS